MSVREKKKEGISRQGQDRDGPKEPFPTHRWMRRAGEGRMRLDGSIK